jgi:peptidyl-prolyl cis-trans isomerase D
MLRGLHKATANWLGRAVTAAILGMIAISFAIWGIGDIFRGFGRSTLAKVGGTEIGIEQFRQAFNDRLQQFARLGRPITQDQARAFGFDRQLLGQMLAEAALDENARTLGLGLSDAEVAKRVMNDPAFRGPTGQFDRTRFEQIIRQAGYNEARFVAEQRRVTLRRQIADTITSGLVMPQPFPELQHQYESEQRAIEYVVLGAAQAGDIPAPDAETLAKYFEAHKALFRAPEYRKIEILELTPEEVARWTEVSDADAKKRYEEQRARYTTPEKRAVQQIVFPNAEEAKAASEKLKAGLSFDELVKERGLKPSDVDLGLVEKSAIVDPAVAEAAFSLAPDSVSAPVAGRFGSVIVRVGKVEPEKARPYEEVAAEIKRDLAIEQARAKVTDLYQKIEDERGAGLPLAKVAEKFKLPTRTIAAVDRSGRNAEGEPVADLPKGVNLLPAAFASDVGVENDPLSIQGGGYVWYDVLGVTPPHDRTLDEVKDKVIARWRDDEIAARLKTKATDFIEKLKNASFADTAAAMGVAVQTASDLTRGKSAAGLPANVQEDVFRLAKDGTGEAQGALGTERYVYRLTAVTVPPFDPNAAETKTVADNIRATYADELLAQYVVQLETDIGTTVNEAALNQVFGGGNN